MINSNIDIKSNIMLKSKVTRNRINTYMPAKLLISLFPEYRDVRVRKWLTEQQRNELDKTLFLADKIVDI